MLNFTLVIQIMAVIIAYLYVQAPNGTDALLTQRNESDNYSSYNRDEYTNLHYSSTIKLFLACALHNFVFSMQHSIDQASPLYVPKFTSSECRYTTLRPQGVLQNEK